jgi:hypothetical protein
LHQVDEAAVDRFLKRDPGVVHGGESATLRRLLAMLRQIGVTVAKASEPGTCHPRFIVDYRRCLLRERGLAEATLVYFVRFAEQFLSARFGNGDLNLSERFLRTGCAERWKNRILRLFQIRQSKECFCLAAFRCLSMCRTGGLLAAGMVLQLEANVLEARL